MTTMKTITWKFISLWVLVFLIAALLILQPAAMVIYVESQSKHAWELVGDSNVREGIFSEEPEEVIFVYRRKKIALPSQLIALEKLPYLVLPPQPRKSQYGDVLRIASGVFLFGSRQL